MPRNSFKNIMNKNKTLKKKIKTLKKEIKTLKKESVKHNETNSNYSEYVSATGSGDGISSLSEGSVTGYIESEAERDSLTDDHDWSASGTSRSRSTGGTRKRHSTRSASRKK